MSRKIYYDLDIGYAGCGDEGIATVDDDMTDSEIDEMVDNMAHDWATSWEGDQRLGFGDPDEDEDYDQQVDDFYASVSGSWRWATEEDE